MRPDTAERRPAGGGVPDEAVDGGNVKDRLPASTVSGGELRAALEKAAAQTGAPLKDLTVLAIQRDPFRLDTPANHQLGEWLAAAAHQLHLGSRRIHLRGLHYMMIGQPKPDGAAYENTEDDWLWLSEKAAKAARWLGYVPFAQITDQRNAEPVIREFRHPRPDAYLSTELDIEIPYDIDPVLCTRDFRGVQPYHLVMIGEKSSLADDLTPAADAFQADLYLPTGEMSDTLIYRIAETAVADGRPMVVLYFADCDPAGHQMIVSVTRKLQAFKVLLPGMPEFETRRVTLTPEQVGEYGLPSTPLKDTELRADRWQAAMGVQQTEVDALTARPGLLRQIARDALSGFYDHDLARRVGRYRDEWLDRASAMIAASFDLDRLAEIRQAAQAQLDGMRAQVRELSDALRIDVDPADLPPIDLPAAVVPEGNGLPLLDSRWDFADQCRALTDSKAYRGGES